MKKQGQDAERSPLMVAGVFGAVGVQFVATTVGALYLGSLLDGRWDTRPLFVLVFLLLSLLGNGIWIVRIARRFVREDQTHDEA